MNTPSYPGGIQRADLMPKRLQRLLALSQRAFEHSYAPYSKVRVGAAVRTAAGKTYLGCNVENASYGLTICAERSAIFAAVAAEGPSVRLAAVAVSADPAHILAAPCGACRQVIAQFGDQAQIVFQEPPGVRITNLDALLPNRFQI